MVDPYIKPITGFIISCTIRIIITFYLNARLYQLPRVAQWLLSQLREMIWSTWPYDNVKSNPCIWNSPLIVSNSWISTYEHDRWWNWKLKDSHLKLQEKIYENYYLMTRCSPLGCSNSIVRPGPAPTQIPLQVRKSQAHQQPAHWVKIAEIDSHV